MAFTRFAIVALVLTVAAPVHAQQSADDIVQEMDAWGTPDHRVVRADGLNMLTFNLNEEARQQFRDANSGANSVFPYITYTTILHPNIPPHRLRLLRRYAAPHL